MSAPAFRRAVRRFTLGSGPLKRRSDRLQVIGRILVVLSLLCAAPLAVAAVHVTTGHLEAVVRAETAERTRVGAVLVADAPDTSMWVLVRAVWAVPDGTSREGDVLAAPRTPTGAVVRVWIDEQGRLTQPPLEEARVLPWAYLAGALTLVSLPLIGWASYVALCHALDARRLRGWEREWAAVEPGWRPGLR